MSTAHQVVDPVAPDIRPDRLAVSPSEAAGMLGISKPSFYNLLNSGQIPSIRVRVGFCRLGIFCERGCLLEVADL